MSTKERAKIRRNNYRAWKQQQKLKKSAAPASSAASAPSVEPASAAVPVSLSTVAPVAQSTAVAPWDGKGPRPVLPGELIPFNPRAPVDVVLLQQRLRFGGPEVTDEERIAIAHRLEQYAALDAGDEVAPEEREEFSKNMRSMLRDSLRRFCIPWPPAGSSESASPAPAPGHSTGPRTAAGLVRSSQNARTHGLSSLTSVFVLLPGEDTGEWVQLVRDLTLEFQPASRTESILVNDMAQSHWLTQRAINLQTSHIDDPKAFALYLRYQTTHHRAYYRALKQLLALQKARVQSGAPSVPDQPAPDFDGAMDLDDIYPLSDPAAEPEPAAPDQSSEPLTQPLAA